MQRHTRRGVAGRVGTGHAGLVPCIPAGWGDGGESQLGLAPPQWELAVLWEEGGIAGAPWIPIVLPGPHMAP